MTFQRFQLIRFTHTIDEDNQRLGPRYHHVIIKKSSALLRDCSSRISTRRFIASRCRLSKASGRRATPHRFLCFEPAGTQGLSSLCLQNQQDTFLMASFTVPLASANSLPRSLTWGGRLGTPHSSLIALTIAVTTKQFWHLPKNFRTSAGFRFARQAANA